MTPALPSGAAPTLPATFGAADPWRIAAARALHPAGRPAGRVPTDEAVAPEPVGRTSRDTEPFDAQPFDTEALLTAIATGLAEVTVPGHLGPEAPPAQRSYELVLSTPLYEAWVLYWPPGSAIELHDHGGSSGAVCVVDGTLVEAWMDERGEIRRRELLAADSIVFGPDHLHDVVNLSDAPATSVHVYAPPLSTMTFYDRDGDGAPRPARTEAVSAEVAS